MEVKFDTNKNLIVNCSEVEGLEHIVGKFVMKRLNLKERIEADVNKNLMTQGKDIEVIFQNVAYALGQLEIAVINKPAEIILDELEVESLFSLFDKYEKWVESFRAKLRKSQETVSKTGE